MKIRGLSFLLLALSCFCLACHGQVFPNSYAGINGNWRLSTTGDAFGSPDQFFTIEVDGSTIIAQGLLSLTCTYKGQSSSMRAQVHIEGEIRPDGTFTLDNHDYLSGPVALGTTVSGKLPAFGQTQWSGNINVAALQIPAIQPTRDCRAASADFAATPLPLVDGTYSGTINKVDQVSHRESDGNVTIAVSQGGLTVVGCGGGSGRGILVKAKLVVAGSSLIPAGTYETEDDNCDTGIFGRAFQINPIHHLGDKASLSVHAQIDPSDDKRIQVTLIPIYLKPTDRPAPSGVGIAQLTRDDDKASR